MDLAGSFASEIRQVQAAIESRLSVQVCSGRSQEQRHSEEQAAKQKLRTVLLGKPHQRTWKILEPNDSPRDASFNVDG